MNTKRKSLKDIAKEIGVAKGKIKDMINRNEISFECENGVYYVDKNEVVKLLKTNLSKSNFKYRKYYQSVIPENHNYISIVSDEFEIDGLWLDDMVREIINYWKDVGKHHKVFEFFGKITPIQYRLLPLSYLGSKNEYESLFGNKLDEDSIFIWIKEYGDFGMNSINLFDCTSHTHSYKKECKVGILNPSTKEIKIFDIDTKNFDIESELPWYDLIRRFTINQQTINYNTSSTLPIGILSKPIGTSYLIVTNDKNTVSWERKVS